MSVRALTLVAAAVTVASCGASSARGTNVSRSPSPPVVATATATATVLPTVPPGGRVVAGATVEIHLGAKKGQLFVSVERTRTANGVTVEARYLRTVNCHRDTIVVCDTKYDVRRRLVESAFTVDAGLSTASLTASVEGKPLRLTWAGYGDPERSAGQYGALMAESRNSLATGSWGRVRHQDKRGDSSVDPLLFRRAYATVE